MQLTHLVVETTVTTAGEQSGLQHASLDNAFETCSALVDLCGVFNVKF